VAIDNANLYQKLADALVTLSQQPALCRQMGENARALAEREFDRRLLAKRLEEVLIRVVKRRAQEIE
jgi:glycosyltransferase involved in cell wall biosynthesis